jgi:ankyrin repeat protein
MNRGQQQQYKGKVGQALQRTNPFLNRTLIPSKEIDPLLISKLLLNVSTNESNILELKEYIIKNGITTSDMINEEGQSILHVVIANDNLSKRQKFDIVKFLRDNFTLMESFDKNGLTPLHIACRLQLTDIAKELLDVGHGINNVDNSYKTPLHYAVIGNQIETPDKIDKKIFPKKKFKVNTNTLSDLSVELSKYINTKLEIKQFIQNQYNTLKNAKDIFGKDIKNILNNEITDKKIIEITTLPTLTPEQKQKRILDIKNEQLKKLKEFLDTKVNFGKKQLNLERNTENGWGPDVNPDNIVMEYKEYNNLEKIINFDIDIAKKTVNDKLRILDSMKENLRNVKNFCENIDNLIIYIYYINKIVNIYITDKDLKKKIIIDTSKIETMSNTKYLFPDLDLGNTADISNDITYRTQTIEIENNLNLDGKSFIFGRDVSSCTDKINDLITKNIITNDDKTNIDAISQNIKLTMIIKTLHKSLEYNYNNLETLIKSFISNLDITEKKIEDINKIILHILSILNCLFDLQYEYEIISAMLQSFVINIFGIYSSGLVPPEYSDIYVNVFTNLQKQTNEMTKTKLYNNIFSDISNIYNILNESIQIINKNTAKLYTLNYFDNFSKDKIYTSALTNINNIYYNEIEPLRDFYKNYEDFKKSIIQKQDKISKEQNKITLFKYLIQMTKINYNIFIDSSINSGKIGYVIDKIPVGIDKNRLELAYGQDGFNDGIINFNYGDQEKIGFEQDISFGNLNRKNKADQIIPISSRFIGEMISIQKYLITRYILQEIYKFFKGTMSLSENTLKELLNELKDDIKQNINLNENDYGLLLITIAKLIDRILNVNLENIVSICASSILNNTPLENEYNLINITQYNKTDIRGIKLDDIEKDIYALFKKNKKLNLYNYFDDILEKQEKSKNIYKIMSSNIGDKPNEIYLETDPYLFDLLLKSGADANARDKDGNTPLIIALLQTNKIIIKLLLKQNVSVSNKKSKNRMGFRPLDISQKIINTTIESCNNSINNESTKQFIQEVNDSIKRLTKINHNMRFNDIIYKILLYLLNHEFYSKLNQYYRQNDENFHDKFFTEITSQLKSLPLIDFKDDFLISYHQNIDKIIESKRENDVQQKINKYEELQKKSIFLQNEQRNIQPEYVYRIDEIIQHINENVTSQPQLNKKYKDIDDYKTQKTNELKIQKDLNKDLNKKLITNLKSKFILISPNTDILKVYDNVVKEILKENPNDYRTYTKLWYNLFELIEKEQINDPTQIISIMLDKIKNNIENYNIINLCKESFEKLSFDINSYFDLPQNSILDNYMLNRINDIYIHIVKNTMCVNFYHILLKLIRAELLVKIPKNPASENDESYENRIDTIINDICTQKYVDLTLNKYIFDILPEKLIKIILKLFEDDDEDKSSDVLSQLKFIERFLEKSQILGLDKGENKIIKILRDYVYPYFKEYFETHIKNLKKITDGYLSMIGDLSIKLEIYDEVLNKKMTEK